MHVGTQHGPLSDDQYRALVQLGVEHVIATPAGPSAEWTTEHLIGHRERIESFGLTLDMIPLAHIGIAQGDEYPNIMLGKSPERDREIERICEVIRSAAAAGIPLLTTVSAALAAARGLADWHRYPLAVRTLQEYHRGVTGTPEEAGQS